MRLTVFLNGDHASTGHVLPVEAEAAFQDLLSAAKAKLAQDQELNLTRAFLASGAEVTSVADLEADDRVFFSFGEDYLAPGPEKRQILQGIASAAVAQALSLYGSSYNYAQSKTPAFAQSTLEKVHNTAAAVATAVAPRVAHYGAPVLNWADSKLDEHYIGLEAKATEFLASPLAVKVNENWASPLRSRSEDFYSFCVESYRKLRSAGPNGQVQLKDFVDNLKDKLGESWNERLVEPTQKFHAAARDEFESVLKEHEGQGKLGSVYINVKEKLGAAWEKAVVANFHHRVRDPAEAFYNTALETFVALEATAVDKKVSWQEFVAGLRVKLWGLWNERVAESPLGLKVGQAWSEKLVEPARHLFDAFSKQVFKPAVNAAQGKAEEVADKVEEVVEEQKKE